MHGRESPSSRSDDYDSPALTSFGRCLFVRGETLASCRLLLRGTIRVRSFDMVRSISVSGRSRLVGMFCTKAAQRFPSTTLYDHTDLFLQAREVECSLAERGLLQNGDDMLQACSRTLSAADVDVHFHDSGESVLVDVRGVTGVRTHTLRSMRSFSQIDRFLDAILNAL